MNETWLFPIPLQGIGTEDVESLPSYLIRSANAHGLTPGQLLSHAVTSYAHLQGMPPPTIALQPGRLCHYVRPNKTTDYLVRSLCSGSGLNHFRQATFLALQSSLDRCVFTFANHLRWCPACFAEFQRADNRGYFKLIWQLNSISHCQIHGVALRDTCSNCTKAQDSWKRRKNCTVCVHCLASLGDDRFPIEVQRSAVTDNADLLLLVRVISTDPELQYPSGGVRAVLNTIFDKVWSREDELVLWKHMSRDEYLSIILGLEPVTLEKGRQIAFKLGLSLTDLLSGTVRETTRLLDPAWTADLPPTLRPVRRRQHRDREKLFAGMRAALSMPVESCPSLRGVAGLLGVSTGCLEHQFPTFCEDVKKKFALRREKEEMRKAIEVHAAVSRYFSHVPLTRNISKKGALRIIRKETGLPKEPLRRAIGEITSTILDPAISFFSHLEKSEGVPHLKRT
jgi:hypothetical protein